MTGGTRFRMGRLDHVHIRVPDRAAAAAWYAEHLGFEPVAQFDFWATAVEGGVRLLLVTLTAPMGRRA